MCGRASAECGRVPLECFPMMFSGGKKVLSCGEPESDDRKCEVVVAKAEEDGNICHVSLPIEHGGPKFSSNLSAAMTSERSRLGSHSPAAAFGDSQPSYQDKRKATKRYPNSYLDSIELATSYKTKYQMEDTAGLREYKGNCHCGRFKFTINIPSLTTVWSCNCSICSRVNC
jgi:hypothetical protein